MKSVTQSRRWSVQPGFLNPQRIELARMRRGLTTTDLAVRLGVSPRTIGSYEKVGAPLARAADLSGILGFPERFFTQRDPADLTGEGINFRAGRLASAVHRRAAIAAAACAMEISGWIDDRFILPTLTLADLSGQDPHTAAELLRASWGLGVQPLPTMVQLAEYFGIRVYSLPVLAEQVDAFSVWSGSTPFIFLARRQTPEQCRLAIAHEIGHLVLHRREPVAAGQERQARIFASEFLLPRRGIMEQLDHNPSVEQLIGLKNTFRIPAMVAAAACHQAGMFNDHTYRQMCVDLHELGYKHGEPDGMARHETSKIFPQVFNPQRFEVAQAAEQLHLPVEEVHGLTFSTALHVVDPQTEPTYFRQSGSFNPQLHLVK